jgi:hypothetical protein
MFLLAALVVSPALAQPVGFYGPHRPKLVVFMVVDQMRADTLTRFADQMLPARQSNGQPGGLRYLIEKGAYHSQCYIDHIPAHTAPGHATLATGADPSVHGIVGNQWWDATGKRFEAYGDDAYPQVHGNATITAAPTLLQGTTFSDEIKLASNGRSRVFSLASKARAAVLMGGHTADLALWLDADTGDWTTSSYYQAALPDWLKRFNADPWIRKFLGWTWKLGRSKEIYSRSHVSPLVGSYEAYQKPIQLPPQSGAAFIAALEGTPLGDTWSFRLGEAVVDAEHLGKSGVPDVLCMSFSSYDKIGHAVGPYSPELQDTLLDFDHDLAEFLGFLQKRVGLENCVLVLTADHGAGLIPEQARMLRMPAGRESPAATVATVESALTQRFGPGHYVTAFSEPNLTLSRAHLSEQQLPEARQVAAHALLQDPAVQAAFTREEILENRLPRTPLGDVVSRSYFDGRSGDVVIVNRPFWIYSHYGATHGTPWTYDTHIPFLMAGPGIQPGERVQRCNQRDIAATLCHLLQVNLPSGCQGIVQP